MLKDPRRGLSLRRRPPHAKEQTKTIRMQITRGLLGKHRYLRAAKSLGGLVHLPTGGRAFYREEQKASLQKQKRGYRNEAGGMNGFLSQHGCQQQSSCSYLIDILFCSQPALLMSYLIDILPCSLPIS